ESEMAAGVLCADCASSRHDSEPGWGLSPGQGWGTSGHRGPLGTMAGSPQEEQPPGDRPITDRPAGQGYYDAYGPYGAVYQRSPDFSDPDRPPWGLGAAICVWLASVAGIVFLPNISVLFWLLYERARGLIIPTDRDQLEKLFAQPRVAFIVISAT